MRALTSVLAAVICFLGHIYARPTTQHVNPPDTIKLRPIPLPAYEVALGLRRRGATPFADLDLASQHQLIYGGPGCKFEMGHRDDIV